MLKQQSYRGPKIFFKRESWSQGEEKEGTERERDRDRDRDRDRETQRILSRLHIQRRGTMGLDPTTQDHDLSQIKGQTLNQLSHPGAPDF